MWRKLVYVKKNTFPVFKSVLMFFLIILAMMTVQINGYMESAEFISDLDRPGKYLFDILL